MRTRLIVILCLALPSLVQAAVNPELQAATARLAPGEVSQGLLLDRVLDMGGASALDGSGAAPAIGPARFRQVVHELHGAASAPLAWPDGEAFRAAARRDADPSSIPLALVDVEIARLRGDALAAGLLRWEGEQLVETGLGDPYLRQPLVAAAGLRAHSYRGGDLRLRLASEHLLRLGEGPAPALALDAGEGLGFRPLALDTPFPVRYTTAGLKTLILRLTRADGAIAYARFTLDVRELQAPPYDELWPLTAETPYAGGVASGQAYLYRAPGHATLENPVIVVEGFDIDNLMGWDELYDLLNQQNLLEDLRAAGYDAVVLNFSESTDYIQRNAYLLVTALEAMQAALADPQQDIALIGASMGGLVARYALAAMEQAGQPHRVRSFISFDSPQMGANIPLGMQYWLDFFRIESESAGHLLSRLDTPAARQMLLYHHTSPPGGTGQPDPLRAVLAGELAALGGYPGEPRKVAIANGSGDGQNQGFSAGEQIVSYEYGSFLVDIVGNIWAVPAVSSHIIFDGEIDRIWPLNDDALSVTVSGTLPFDSAPGGSRASMAEMDATEAPYGDIIALHDAHCFIPTVSALALDEDDPFFDIAGAGDLLALTPFDALYFPQANQDHVLVTAENKAWFMAEIEAAPTGLPSLPSPAAAALVAYPNPFNPSVSLDVALPAPAAVEIAIHDVAGRRVRALRAGRLAAGQHRLQWDGRDEEGRALPSGVYLARLGGGGGAGCASARLVLLR
jgi:hypothetical protein